MKKPNTPFLAAVCLLAACSAFVSSAHADSSESAGMYMQYGTRSQVDGYTVGVTAPMRWSRPFLDTKATAYWDLNGTFYSANNPYGPDFKTWQASITPTVRLRFDQGRSNWFVEGGIGLSYTDVVYQSHTKKFSTRFNFADHVGVGVSFGQQRSQEVVLRFQHYSNAGIKNPNPGENFVQIRYAHAF